MSNVSCLFLIDSTGSMGWVHRELRERLSEMMSLFELEGVRADFGIAAFRDALADSNTAWEPLGFGHPVPEQKQFLHQLRTMGGGNNRGESSMFAIANGVKNLQWPDDSRRKVIALFTDDSGHMPDRDVNSWPELSTLLHTAKIEQIHLFVTERKMRWYDPLSRTKDCLIIRHTLSKDLEQLQKSIKSFVKTTSIDTLGGEAPLLGRDVSVNSFSESEKERGRGEEDIFEFDDENIFDEDYLDEEDTTVENEHRDTVKRWPPPIINIPTTEEVEDEDEDEDEDLGKVFDFDWD